MSTAAIEKAERELEAITRLLWRVHDRDGAIQAGVPKHSPEGMATSIEDLAVEIVIDSTHDWYAFPSGVSTVLRVKNLGVELTSDTLPTWQIEVWQKRHRESTVAALRLWASGKARHEQITGIAADLVPHIVADPEAGRALTAALQRMGGHWERKLVAMIDMQLHRATRPLAEQAPENVQIDFALGGAS